MREVVTSLRIIKDLGVTDECVMDKANVLSGLLQRAESGPVDGKVWEGGSCPANLYVVPGILGRLRQDYLKFKVWLSYRVFSN